MGTTNRPQVIPTLQPARAASVHGRALDLAVWCADQTTDASTRAARASWTPIREAASQVALAVVEALLLPRRREALGRAERSLEELRERVVSGATAVGVNLVQVRFLLDEIDAVEGQVAALRRGPVELSVVSEG
ncbi:hypothetical protein [Engelhardtia mirabilis]|uniref:Uncharacterized protein n=1 Tax=Engelhardtia mirabilis TaxID=2528011 RepID=A0A518BG10_9BACT|nr:hypothetical protein Pla133_09800 [Planctomycetes bacterium Pla133]QDV00240.1 hypothetical protein Pla86_09790 [Planctomycetes bacterium Pla86]